MFRSMFSLIVVFLFVSLFASCASRKTDVNVGQTIPPSSVNMAAMDDPPQFELECFMDYTDNILICHDERQHCITHCPDIFCVIQCHIDFYNCSERAQAIYDWCLGTGDPPGFF